METTGCYSIRLPDPTLRQRIGWRLFPHPAVLNMDMPENFKDWVTTITHVNLDWRDRIRLLFTGHLKLEIRTYCQNEVGATQSIAVSSCPAPKFLS